MLGYLTAGITINFFSQYVTWRFSIQIQGFAQFPIALFFFLVDEKYINIQTDNAQDDIEFLTQRTQRGKSILDPNLKQEQESKNQSEVEMSPKKPQNPAIVKKVTINPDLPVSPNGTIGGKTLKRNPSSVLNKSKSLKRQSTRIDAVEINHLERFCSQTQVLNKLLF